MNKLLLLNREPSIPVILMAGQSNCTGLGVIASAPAKYQAAIAKTYIWKSADSTWPQLLAGTNNDAADSNSFGTELSLGTYLAENTGLGNVRLVKYQASGKSLAVDFLPTAGTNYVAMIAKFDAAIADMVSKKVKFHIAGIVWIQGENDATLTNGATYGAAYNANLTSLISNLRTKYNVYGKGGDVPFIISQLGSIARAGAGEWYYTDLVRQAQIDVAAAVNRVKIVKTDDLAVSDANVHYSTNSYLTLGDRIAASLVNISATYAENRPPAFLTKLTQWYNPNCPFITDASAVAYILGRSTAKVIAPGQSTAGKKPTLVAADINGKAALSFDGGDVLNAPYTSGYSMLDFFSTNELHMIWLLNRNAVTQGQIIAVTRSSSGNVSLSVWDDGNIYFDFGAADATGRTFGTIPANFTGNYRILEAVRRTNGSQQLFVDGVSIKSDTGKSAVLAAGTGTLNIWMGGLTATPTIPFNGKIAEGLCYKQELTAAERTAAYAYLAAEYGTTVVV